MAGAPMRVFGVDVTVREGDTAAAAPAERVVDLRTVDGAPFLTVDRSATGWRLDAPDYGRHLVAPDGRTVLVDPADADRGRLLVAQSLPTAAALQGRDLFHAAAIRTPAGVLALSGPSGSGKSTLTGLLAERGRGTAFSDDVLAVGAAPHGVTAFAGPTVGDDPGSVPAEDTAPLHALVLLDRRAEPGGVRVAAPAAAELPRELLAAAFVPHVDTPQRLLTRLEVCARLLAEGRVHRLLIGTDADAAATADALERLLA